MELVGPHVRLVPMDDSFDPLEEEGVKGVKDGRGRIRKTMMCAGGLVYILRGRKREQRISSVKHLGSTAS